MNARSSKACRGKERGAAGLFRERLQIAIFFIGNLAGFDAGHSREESRLR